MGTSEAYYTYAKNQVETISQEKLVLMLYDGALKFITMGKQACESKDLEKTNTYILRAQAILAELRGNLVREAGEIADHLFALYDYMYRRLIEANINKDTGTMDEVHGLLQDLRKTWAEVLKGNQDSYQEVSTQRKGLTV